MGRQLPTLPTRVRGPWKSFQFGSSQAATFWTLFDMKCTCTVKGCANFVLLFRSPIGLPLPSPVRPVPSPARLLAAFANQTLISWRANNKYNNKTFCCVMSLVLRKNTKISSQYKTKSFYFQNVIHSLCWIYHNLMSSETKKGEWTDLWYWYCLKKCHIHFVSTFLAKPKSSLYNPTSVI